MRDVYKRQARHSETEEEMVVYRALYGERGLWVRPAAMWCETVERDGRVQGVSGFSSSSLDVYKRQVYDTLPHRRENFRWVIDNTHDTLCFNCGRRDTCWKQEYAATLEGMEAPCCLPKSHNLEELKCSFKDLELYWVNTATF